MKKVITKKKLLIILPAVIVMVLSIILIIEKNTKKLSSEVIDKQNKEKNISSSIYVKVEDTLKEENNSDIADNQIINNEDKSNSLVENTSNKNDNLKKENSDNTPIINNEVPKDTTNNDNSSTSNNTNNNNSNNTNNSNDNNSNNDVPPSVQEEPQVEEDNSVRTNDIFYRIHKGRIDYTDLDTCQSETLNFYLNYIRNINNLNYIEVMSNSDKILGYFVQYVFKEASYNNYDECNSIGNSIKSSLSDRVTGYQCSERDNNYYLKIFTDYD